MYMLHLYVFIELAPLLELTHSYGDKTKHMISSTSYATKWYITLFANTFPFQTQLRLWDAFFLEGRDVIVITAVAIIWVLKGMPQPHSVTQRV